MTLVIRQLLAELPVADLEVALAWYERFLGRPADRRPMDGLAEWDVPGTGGLQLWQDAERAGAGLLTLLVEDLAAQVEAMTGRGVAAGTAGQATSLGAAIMTVTDPDGNTITLVDQSG